jgi:putative Holliday junction resolvase
VLALDPGAKRIGIAVSDAAQTMAFPRPALRVTKGIDVPSAVRSLCHDEGAALVVVGLPKTLSGRDGSSAMLARSLAEQLIEATRDDGIGVELHDERFTTVEASRALAAAGHDSRAQRSLIDSAAATVLLEAWLQCQ